MNFLPESTASTSRDPAHQVITPDHRMPSSPTSTSFGYYKPTMEDQDMANCLIMLAQSDQSPPINEHKSDLYCHKSDKLKFRSVTEMVTDGGGSVFQSYECKTCYRAFPSFQALGGHRASHKKPKLTIEDKINTVPMRTDQISIEDQPKLAVDYEENKIITNSINKPSSPAVTGSIQTGYRNCKGKIHECSICGSEFLSGQALGGHMRRHRTLPPSINQISVSTNMNDSSGHHITEKSPVLSLDLNLPAPEVVDDSHSNFQFTPSSSQKPLVFSAAALVDCYY